MYSKLIIVGNVGKDPEMRYTPSGKPVTTFSVATNRHYANEVGETIKETLWFRVTTWGRSAEACNQYVKKGSKVLVEGRLAADPKTGGPRIWFDQEGGPHAGFEMNSSEVKFLSSAKDGGSSPSGQAESEFTGAPEDDIPF